MRWCLKTHTSNFILHTSYFILLTSYFILHTSYFKKLPSTQKRPKAIHAFPFGVLFKQNALHQATPHLLRLNGTHAMRTNIRGPTNTRKKQHYIYIFNLSQKSKPQLYIKISLKTTSIRLRYH